MTRSLLTTAQTKAVSVTGCLTALFAGLFGTQASAQIVPDNTLPMNSVVPPGCAACTITGGTTVGSNLFHSFQQFSIDGTTINSALFNNSVMIDNIITRVTGIDQSFINGLISANGGANLFLLNPNGLVFGPNAALNIGGSFVGSTAESVQFAGGGSYSAVNPQAPPLLAMNVPIGLQFGPNPAPIQVQGPGNFLFIDDPNHFETVTAFRPPGLQVAPGQTLALVGGDVTLEGGNLTAIDGRVETGAVRGPGVVSITPSPMGFTLGYDGINNFADVRLITESSIDVSGNGVGQVQVQGRQVVVTDASAILANTRGIGTGGQITVNASESLEVSGFRPFNPNEPFGPLPVTPPFISQLSTDVATGSPGTGGIIEVNAGALGLLDGGQLSADTFGSGIGGTINVNTGQIFATRVALETVNGASGIFAEVRPGASGQGGTINIDTGSLTLLEGAQIRTGTFASGDAGTLNIRAQNIEAVFGSQVGPSGIFSSPQPGASGNGGTINIEAQRLTLVNGASIGVNTFGEGDGGTLNVNAEQIELLGAAFGNLTSTLAANVEAGATGNGGTLILNTGSLSLVDGGQIQNTTLSTGDAGNAQIMANIIEILGTTPTDIPSGIFSNVEASAVANGGSLNIFTDNLVINDGGQIASSTLGMGDTGSLVVQSNEIILTGGTDVLPSAILTTVEPGSIGSGGSLTIITDQLQILEGAQVTSSTFGRGNAGSLNVQANEILLIGSSERLPSSIAATIEPGAMGESGNLTINSDRLQVSGGAQIINSNRGGIGDTGSLSVTANSIELTGIAPPIPSRNEILPSAILSTLEPGAIGNGRALTITSDSLVIQGGAQIQSSNLGGRGNAGPLSINASNIELIGTSTPLPGSDDILPSGIFAIVESGAVGNGGSLRVNSDRLRLVNGAQISSSLLGQGEAGSLFVETQQLELIGTSASIPGNEILPSGIFSNLEPGAFGNGGDLTVITDNLSVVDGGQIATTTGGNGDAGDLRVTAQNIELSGTGPIATSGLLANATNNSFGRGGNIFVSTDQITLIDGATLTVSNFPSLDPNIPPGRGPAGNITLQARNLLLDDGILTADTVTGMDANITLNVTEAITLNNNAQITTDALGTGTGGSIELNTGALSIESGSQISANATQAGAGSIEITTTSSETLLLDQGEITATGGEGDIQINTAAQLQLQNGSLVSTNALGENSGGSIDINAANLRVDNSTISANAPVGGAGDINIQTTSSETLLLNQGQITATGGSGNIKLQSPSQLELRNNSLISTDALGSNSGGSIEISTANLQIQNSAISANAPAGGAGNIDINTSSSDALLLEQGRITATGGSGNINLKTPFSLVLVDDSLISTDALGDNSGGNIDIETGTLNVIRSAITSNATAGGAGNINIFAPSPQTVFLNQGQIAATGGEGNISIATPLLQLDNESLISTNGIDTAVGGNILLNLTFLIASGNSDITANAEQGPGGRVVINAAGIFGIQFQPRLTSGSDITATSELGPAFNGNVEVNLSDVDPTKGFRPLPQNVLNVADQVREACSDEPGNTFGITGRGGVPDDARKPLRPGNTWEDRRLIEPDAEEKINFNSSDATVASVSEPLDKISEAIGWVQDESGQIQLVTDTHSMTSTPKQLETPNLQCQANAG